MYLREKCTCVPSKDTFTAAFWPGSSVVTPSTTGVGKGRTHRPRPAIIVRTSLRARNTLRDAKQEMQRAPHDTQAHRRRITRIECRHAIDLRRYGYRRIYHLLRQEGVILLPDRVRRLMGEAGLVVLQPRTYVPQTSDGRADKPSDNLLQGRPLPAKPNEVWTGDINYIPSEQGWLYLAVISDLCSRRIVGWSLRDHLRSDLVVEALDSALAARRSTRGIMLLRYAHPSESLRLAVSLRSAP